MSGQDYLKFLTEELTHFMNEPSRMKKKRKLKKTLSSDHWFGILPLAIRTFLRKNSR